MWWRIWVLKPIQGPFPILHLQRKLICLLIKYLFYIQVLFTVSNPKHSNPIPYGGKGKGIKFFTSRYDPVGFALLGQVSERAFFSRSLEYFFFSVRLWPKRQKLFKKKLRSYNSNLLLVHFYIACQVSFCLIEKKLHNFCKIPQIARGMWTLFLTWKRSKKIRGKGTVNEDFQNCTQTLDNARTVSK